MATNPGAKHDTGKPAAHSVLRYFPRAIEAVARVSEHGASIHGWDTWHTIDRPAERYAEAQTRHELARCKGEMLDPESNLLHLAHLAWNAMARLELALREGD